MKTLIFNGSPRHKGDTASLLTRLTALLPGEVVTVDAYRCGIRPCVDCRWCWTHSGCAIPDGMQAVYETIASADNLVIASPVYFSELTGPLLSVCSRLQMLYCNRTFQQRDLRGKVKRGAVILVGGGDGAMDKAQATAVTLLHQMNAGDIHPLVSTHDTNHVPAAQDAAALAGVDSIARFFAGGDHT